MHLPDGQSEAPSAEHFPAQLSPLPQVTVLGVLSKRQQTTVMSLLAKLKELSKKSTEFALFPEAVQLLVTAHTKI